MSPRKPPPKDLGEQLDDELDGTFPASDPPSLTEPAGDARRRREKDEKDQD